MKIIIATIFMLLLLSQCVSTPADKPILIVKKSTVDAIIKDFNVICYSMLKGDTQTIYAKYLSSSIQDSQSYDEFVTDYETNKETYKRLFSGAILKQIAPEDNLASAIIVWGNGDSALIEFIKENSIWKINHLRGPAVVFDHNMK